jgi:hypothetical protein
LCYWITEKEVDIIDVVYNLEDGKEKKCGGDKGEI